MHFDLRVPVMLEAFDEQQIHRGHPRHQLVKARLRASRNSCIKAQRREEATMTSRAPA